MGEEKRVGTAEEEEKEEARSGQEPSKPVQRKENRQSLFSVAKVSFLLYSMRAISCSY